MKSIEEILVERDGLTPEEAHDLVRSIQAIMAEAIAQGDYLEAEEIFTSELGLEPDYLDQILPL